MIYDYFHKPADELKNKKLWLFDMDGTIYMENQIYDGTLDLLNYITSIGGKYVFITNNSSKSVNDYIAKVNNMGIKADKDNFYTSTQATAKYIKDKYGDILLFAVGTKSFLKELDELGIRYTTDYDENVEAVILSYDNELTYEKLRNISKLLTKFDLPYIATNPDLVCPVEFGYVPDCGSFTMMIKNATGKSPIFIGKPEPTMIEFVIKKYGFRKENSVVIGDRIYTDIASGLNAGVCSVCVLSGESTLETIKEDNRKPTYVFKDVKEIYELIAK